MKKFILSPSERFTFDITCVAYTPKDDTAGIGKYITLTLVNADNPFFGSVKIGMFADGPYGQFFSMFAPSLAKAKADGKGKPTAEDGKASIVLRDEELAEYVNDKFLHVLNAGFCDIEFDQPMVKVWGRDMNNVIIGKNSDGTPQKGNAKKGSDVYDGKGNLSMGTGCQVFLSYLSKDGSNTSPFTPYERVIESAMSRYRPIAPTAPTATPAGDAPAEEQQVNADDII